MHVLKTRLYKPVVEKGFLVRKRLLDLIESNIQKPLLLVVAAAGYGKSVLISQWLDQSARSYSWISLDRECNDLRTFLSYLCESIRPFATADLDEFCEMVQAPVLPNSSSIHNIVARAIASIEKEHVHVFDDYHLINNKEVHALVNELVNSLSSKHTLAIAARSEPGIIQNNLKVYDRVNEIIMGDLQFTADEIRTLSIHNYSNQVDAETSSAIVELTEGWIIPIRLMLKRISEEGNALKVINSYQQMQSGRSENQLYAFLSEEFSKEVPHALQESLLVASLCNRFSIPLISEIHQYTDPDGKVKGQELVNQTRQLIEQSLFIIPLDNDNEWYRYHHLIRKFLQTKIKDVMSKEKINQSLSVACDFFESAGSITEAIQISIQAENIPLAIEIFDRHRHTQLDMQRFDILDRWLKILPSGTIEMYPSLLLTRAIIFDTTMEMDKMYRDLGSARRLLPPLDKPSRISKLLWGEYYSIKSYAELAWRWDIPRALDSATKAMELLTPTISYLHDFALAQRVFALLSLGQSCDAFDLLKKNKAELKIPQKLNLMNNQIITVMALNIEGKSGSYEYEALLARDIAREESALSVFIWANYYLAVSSYSHNDVDLALAYVEASLECQFSARPNWILLSYFMKAACLLAQGQTDEYNSCIKDMSAFSKQYSAPTYEQFNTLLQIELCWMEGDLRTAWEKSKKIEYQNINPIHIHHQPCLTEVKLLLARGENQNLDRAGKLIKEYEQRAGDKHNRNQIIQISCLKIILEASKGNRAGALEQLRKSLSETREDGLVRLYTVHGREMESLINLLSPEEKTDPYVIKILDSFKPLNLPTFARQTDIFASFKETPHFINARYTIIAGKKIKLSQRELTLLWMLGKGLQDKEISARVNIEPDSVRKSLYRLYRKLEVNSRTDAVYKALEIGAFNSIQS